MNHPPLHERLRRAEYVEAVRPPRVRQPSAFAQIEPALEAVRNGRMIIVVDDRDRENEGDLMIAAEKATRNTVNFWRLKDAASSAWR
jgi:hypothetical protein